MKQKGGMRGCQNVGVSRPTVDLPGEVDFCLCSLAYLVPSETLANGGLSWSNVPEPISSLRSYPLTLRSGSCLSDRLCLRIR